MWAKAINTVTEKALTLKEILKEQAANGEGQVATQKVGYPASCNSYDRECILMRRAQINGAIQLVVSVTLRAGILYLSLYSKLGEHARVRRTYDTMQQQLNWLHIVSDVYSLVHKKGAIVPKMYLL